MHVHQYHVEWISFLASFQGKIEGNLPGRKAPGVAHGRYFSYPDASGPEDIATLLQEYIQLNIDNDLEDLLDAPGYLEESRVTR